jgi:hypothetical protein
MSYQDRLRTNCVLKDDVFSRAQAAVDTFGIEEIRTWSFECWNELWGMPFPGTYMA